MEKQVMGYYWNTGKRQLDAVSEEEELTEEEEAIATIEEYELSSEEEVEVESEDGMEDDEWEEPEYWRDSQIEDSEEEDEAGYNTFQKHQHMPFTKQNGEYLLHG
ncbi:hypothetical protein C8F04DRAFT_1172747 [Mycena alexandri]|uniref:Uncharacterized protein n=1 Tax=Mycena alexandri TaxID=1745969 RepID=A0AAD6SM86_9AGAR|nr:hypothetical protein C8F04DRAFT_1187728 [Mycena alexandri]KAJ7046948.1 hypothetical protein C8F04DRAFT_1172747 [Mycena alexandri]